MSNVCNYRLISKKAVIQNIVKALITTKVSGLMSDCLSNRQHGFRSKHSVITNNLIFQYDILDCIGEEKTVKLHLHRL